MKGSVETMALHLFVTKEPISGVVGAAAYDAVRKGLATASLRKATVIATAWGIRVVHEAERMAQGGAEQARLTVDDVVAAG
jgi:hypothetical protein